MKPSPRIGAAYVRVSTDDQTEYSPASQLAVIEDYAQRHGIWIPPEYRFQEDDGVSGRQTKHRTEFLRMIGVAKTKPKPFDVILLWRFSRFARNRQDSVVYKSMLRKELGIEVVSVNEPLPEDDKISLLMEALIEAMDEYYSINLAEDVRRGMQSKVQRGEAVGIPPFGYRIESKHFYPDPATAPVVQMIFQEYLGGSSQRDLAVRLNQLGIRTRRGGQMEARTIDYILHNPVYVGKLRYSPTGRMGRAFDRPDLLLVAGLHEPIITPEQWERTQARLQQEQRQPRTQSHPHNESVMLLRGLCRCSACGGTLTRSGVGLNCNRYAHGLCSVSHYVGEAALYQAILNRLVEDFTVLWFSITPKINPDDHGWHPVIQAQLVRERQRLTRAQLAYEAGVDTLEEYRASKATITARIEALHIQREAKSAAVQNVSTLHLDAIQLLRDGAVSAGVKRQLLQTLIDHVVLDRTRNTLTLYYRAA